MEMKVKIDKLKVCKEKKEKTCLSLLNTQIKIKDINLLGAITEC